MPQRLESFLNQRASDLMEGRLRRYAATHALPAIVFHGPERMVLTDRNSVMKSAAKLRSGLLEKGVRKLTLRPVAIGLPNGGAFRVWLDIDFLDQNGMSLWTVQAIYYLRQTEDGLLVDMSEYGEVAQPAIMEEEMRA